MKLLNRSQKGFTLIELLIALPIIAIVVAAATGALIQVIQSTSTSAHMVALRQVQTAGYWVSKDGLQAQSITTGPGVGFPLTLNWTDWNDEFHHVVYSLENMPSGTLKQLQRQESVNGTLVATTMVGQYIDAASCAPGNKTLAYNETLTFTVTAKVPGARRPQTERRTYEIKPRPD